MNAERESFEPARRSTLLSTSDDNVIEVFSFILLLYYQAAWKELRDDWTIRPGARKVASECIGNGCSKSKLGFAWEKRLNTEAAESTKITVKSRQGFSVSSVRSVMKRSYPALPNCAATARVLAYPTCADLSRQIESPLERPPVSGWRPELLSSLSRPSVSGAGR